MAKGYFNLNFIYINLRIRKIINQVILTGRLTKEPDILATEDNKHLIKFTLAVKRNFKNAQNQIEADFIKCFILEKRVQTFVTYAHKGNLIGIVGQIKNRNYFNEKGKKVYTTEIDVKNFYFLEKETLGLENTTRLDNNPDLSNFTPPY